MEADDHRKNKSEHNSIRGYHYKLKGLENCEVLYHWVLAFGMVHINNLKVKDLGVLL